MASTHSKDEEILANWLSIEKGKVPHTFVYDFDSKINRLNAILGAFACLGHELSYYNSTYITAKETAEALRLPIPDELFGGNIRGGAKKPRIGLWADITTKGNLSISWTPLDFINDGETPEFFLKYSSYKRIACRPENELCFIHGVDSIGHAASVDKMGSLSTHSRTTVDAVQYVRTLLAQQTVECIESIMPAYAQLLGRHYDVWMLNAVTCDVTESTSKISISDNAPRTLMIRNLLSNVHHEINPQNFSSFSVKPTFQESYVKIKERCLAEIAQDQALHDTLAKLKLTREDILDTARRCRRNSVSAAASLSKKCNSTVTPLMLQTWINEMHSIRPEFVMDRLSHKPAFNDLATNTDLAAPTPSKAKIRTFT